MARWTFEPGHTAAEFRARHMMVTSVLGELQTPWWDEENGVWTDKGPKLRVGFVATTQINRHDFGVSGTIRWTKGGVVVGDTVSITIDVEAVRKSD